MCLGTDSAGARMLPGLNSSLLGYNGQTVEGHTVKNAPKCIHAHGLTCLPISLSVSLSPGVNWAPSCQKCYEPNWKDSEPTWASTKIPTATRDSHDQKTVPSSRNFERAPTSAKKCEVRAMARSATKKHKSQACHDKAAIA